MTPTKENVEAVREKCKNEHCDDMYPSYGVAPHTHNIKNPGSFIGSTEVLDKSKWPDNFKEDPDCEGLGTYVCPDCGSNGFNDKKRLGG